MFGIYARKSTDVLIIGAGGAGMRAAIAAYDAGSSVTIVSKSILGKAHTVMAEGGIAASVANVDSKDNWQTHFSDTYVEGGDISNWKMAEILAKEAPERVYELESYGAIFDRTPEGKIMQRAFGGHTYRRLCHVGDKTGLELMRTLEDQLLHRKIDVIDEFYVTKLIVDSEGKVAGAFGIRLSNGEFVAIDAKTVIIATGGCGRVYRVTSNSWESTGDGIGLAYDIGAELMDMEMIQFHPTGMVYPPGVEGILVTEGVRGEGGILLNSKHERFMLKYSPKRKELDTRDVVARSIYAEIQKGNGTEHGGVYLDISYMGKSFILSKLPAMYSQFLKFANVDITKQPMEVAPTVHYQMGGIRVDPETGAASVKGLFAAGECTSGLHGANRLGGNSLADILVFGKRAGTAAGKYAKAAKSAKIADSIYSAEERRVSSFLNEKGENPYYVINDLRDSMSNHVGIIRSETELNIALESILAFKKEYLKVGVNGKHAYNKGLLACLELGNMLIACEGIVRSALMRKESRGAHARSDFPERSEKWHVNIICRRSSGKMKLDTREVPELPQRLAKIIKRG